MGFLVSIAGVDRTTRTRVPSSVRIEYELGARARADLEVLDLDSFETAYRPALDQTLVIRTLSGTPLFSGSIWSVDDGPLGEPGVGTVTRIQAINDWRFAAQRRVAKGYDAGWTLRGVVSDLVTTYLSVFGMTLDPGMPVGPTLPALTFDQSTVEDVFARLMDVSGWVYRLTPANVIQWFPIGGKPRAITLSAANHNILGAVRWAKSRNQTVNHVFVRYGTATLVQKFDYWTGNADSVFPLTYPGVLYPNGMIYGWAVTESGLFYPCALWGVDTGYLWYYDNAINALRRASPAPIGAPIEFSYMVQFPLTVSAPTPPPAVPTEVLVERPEIFDKAEAQAVADSLVRRYTALPRTVRNLRTRAAPDLLPGDTVTLDVPSRTLPGAPWMITGVSLSAEVDQEFTTSLTLLEGTEAQASWLDYWREAFSTGTGSGVGVASGGAIPSTPPPPAPVGQPGGGDLTGAGTAYQLAAWTDTKVLANAGLTVDGSGTLTGGATGAGFTINLTASTVTGILPVANLPMIPVNKLPATIAYWNEAETFTQVNTFASGQIILGDWHLHADLPAIRYWNGAGTTQYGLIYGHSSGLTVVGAAGPITLSSPTGLVYCSTAVGGGIVPTPGYTQNLGTLQSKWLSLHAAELWVETLVAQDTMATIGGRIVVCPTTVLTRDLSGAGVTQGQVMTIYVKHNALRLHQAGVTMGSTLLLESGGRFEAMTVFDEITPPPTAQGDYAYNVARAQNGVAEDWFAGDAVMDTGRAGDGFIDMYSTRGIGGGNGPAIVGNVRASTNWYDWNPRWAIGHLPGLYGYGLGVYGAAFGDPNTTHLTIDTLYGIRIRYGASDRLVADTDGNLTLSGNLYVAGVAQISAGGVTITSNGIEVTLTNALGWPYAYNFNSPYDAAEVGMFAWETANVSRNVWILNGSSTVPYSHAPEAWITLYTRTSLGVVARATIGSNASGIGTFEAIAGGSTSLVLEGSGVFQVSCAAETGKFLLSPVEAQMSIASADGQRSYIEVRATPGNFADVTLSAYGGNVICSAASIYGIDNYTDLGQWNRRWRTLYVTNLTCDGGGGNITIVAGNVYPYTDNATYLGYTFNRYVAVYAVNGAIQTSDAASKTDIDDNPLGLAFVERLRPRRFRYVDDPTPGRIGFLTQDVEAALDGVPFAALDKPATGPSGLNYAGFVPVLTQAVQELAARVRALEGRPA